ncbi:extracellular solute-binding protein [Rhizobium mesoamericanum]|nr:extracellular solute-binding protein [Rhizobium mesoamericanum]
MSRTVAAVGMLVSITSALTLAPAIAHASGKLVLAFTGGEYEKTLRKTIFDRFTKETGIEVVFVSGSLGDRWGKAKAMTEGGQMDWDLIEVGSGDLYIPDRNALLLDVGQKCELVPKAFIEGAPGTCNRYGVLPGVGSTYLVANQEGFPNGVPSSWADFFDTKKFPGPRGLSNFGDPWRVLVGALLADGVPKDKLFPLDLDRSFHKLDQIKPEIVLWWKTGDQIQRAFREKEVVLAPMWGTRTNFLIKEGLPLKPIWNGATLNTAYWSIFKSAPNKDNAIKFLNWYFDHPDVEASSNKAQNAAPVTKQALAQFTPDEQKDLPTSEENMKGVVIPDYEWLAQHNNEITERWNSWLAQ